MKIFQSALLRLTFFYVLIAMTISVIFSAAIYEISSNELNRGLGRQAGALRQLPPGNDFFNQQMQNLEQIRQNQLQESNVHLRNNLIYYNLLILVLASIISYFLAKKTLKPIEDVMDAQNRFTADASHELRTPLAAMKAEIEVNLRDKRFNFNQSKKLLKSNLEEIEKLENLASALLKISRIQEEKKEFVDVDISEVIIEAFEKVEKSASKKEIEFDNKLMRKTIKGDRQSLIELFVILMDNAIKYSPPKSKVNILMKKESNRIIIKVKDNGLGIKASDLPHIFERFYRADTSRSKEKVEGFGLGLSIAKEIVDCHGGKISVESIPAQGSQFIVSFKCSQ